LAAGRGRWVGISRIRGAAAGLLRSVNDNMMSFI
jgi:hypothetical protein